MKETKYYILLKKQKINLLLILLSIVLISCTKVAPPKSFGPLPLEKQLKWHELQYYAFIHFNMNTFTDIEWGLGSESPKQFNPTNLDARQWARVAKESGMKGIIITAKHHDGFCLWPSKYTEHSVKNSPWKNGKGDLIKELSEACKEYGLKLGLYLSPWDRNNEHYGSSKYVEIFHNQLRELMTNYGDIFEVWFDGANGGSGYYGGANETRKIDNKTYYQWNKALKIIEELQPNAVVFGDGGPGVRWVGNESGWANETNWSLLRRDEVYPGYPKYKELRSGHEDGTHWIPAECDVSIRPGWYYHQAEDNRVKTLPQLLDIYYQSVGRNASMLLNLPVDKRGLVHENDVKQLTALKNQLNKDFAIDLAKGAKVTTSDIRGNATKYRAENLNDGDATTYWTSNDGVRNASILFEFAKPTLVNRILLQEYIALGQRVKGFTIEAEVDGNWQEIDRQTTIGYKRILRFKTLKATKIRVRITDAKAIPILSTIEIYKAPNLLAEPLVSRDKKGMVSMLVPDTSISIYYTLNGETPTVKSEKYIKPFLVDQATLIKAIAFNPEEKQQTKTVSTYFDLSKKDWKIIKVSSGDINLAKSAIDDNPFSYWNMGKATKNVQEIIIDLGEEYTLKGFTYWPIQIRNPYGIITQYEFSLSKNNLNWKVVSKGEFGNIKNNPIEQKINFKSSKAKYIKLKVLKTVDNNPRATIGELGIITKNL